VTGVKNLGKTTQTVNLLKAPIISKDTLDYHNGNKAHKRAEDIFRIKQNYLNICLLSTFFNL
jgi:hypothetical protein